MPVFGGTLAQVSLQAVTFDSSNDQPLINVISWVILGLRPANERRRYKVTPSLIDWVQT